MVHAYKDKAKSIQERADDLLSRMTLDEKIDQMHVMHVANYSRDMSSDIYDVYNAIKAGEEPKRFFGALFNLVNLPKKIIDTIQRYALTKTRLGIPVMVMGEALHGLIRENCTRFPQNIGLGCTFNESLVEEIAAVIGRESYTNGFRQVFAPNVDVIRELHWGRVQENYGEDQYLVGRMGAAYVRGVQSQGVAATVKHYLGYGMPENGLNLSSVHIGERDLREQILPPFEDCVREGAKSIMLAYHDMDGVPLHVSKYWANDVLRGELNFEGTTISDWDALTMLNWYQHCSDNKKEIGKMTLTAGLDIEAPTMFGYADEFKKAVECGEIDEKLVDRAVLRILKLKFELGLFDGKAFNFRTLKKNKKSLALARKAAEQSIVLLKNDGILPLKKEVKKVAVFGPCAQFAPLGGYTYYPTNDTTPKTLYDGLVEHLGQENVLFAQGTRLLQTSEEMIKEAVETAKQADVLILACGDSGRYCGGGLCDEIVNEPVLCGENFDMHDIRIPEAQRKLFETLKNTGKPLVLTLFTGRPNVIVNEFEQSNAVLQAWYPGEMGGLALADILFGNVNPTGKLCVSFPRSNGHFPCNYNHRKSARGNFWKKPGTIEKPGKDYVLSSPKAFLTFGDGLGYVPITYHSIKAKKTDEFTVEVKVTLSNDGAQDTEESVLIFTSCSFSNSVIVPYEKLLKAFKRVKLKAGQKRTICFTLDKSAFSYLDLDMKKAYASGEYVISTKDCSTSVIV